MKILIISSNLIGDTILSSGIVNFFYEKYPKAKFTFVVGPSAGQIYYNFPAKEKIILVKKKFLIYIGLIFTLMFIKLSGILL